MKQTLHTYGKNGVIRITGDLREVVLYLNDIPIQYSWYAEEGTTMRYSIAQFRDKPALPMRPHLRKILMRGIQNVYEHQDVVHYFHSFLSYGTYTYGLYQMPYAPDLMYFPPGSGYQLFHDWGGGSELIPTQQSIDPETVAQFADQIRKGVRPTAVLLHVEQSDMLFIVDGHHKIRAYHELHMGPQVLLITKNEQEILELDAALELAGKMDCKDKGFLNALRKERSQARFSDYYSFAPEKDFDVVEWEE